ncbi:MAG: 5'/3'-nucleotidase SurE [Planctomycetes bacterium]|nr:5'/3'-nucleotidase SurE [Planctomycetota bacterium]
MNLLLTNDDGVQADGLAALERAMAPFGTVYVVAPRNPFSGCGHQVTTHRPLNRERLGDGRFAVDGSPADCTRLGILRLAPRCDWVLAGINAGGNLGVDIHMSGTVAAAREAAMLGHRAIAFSQYRRRRGEFRWDRAGRIATQVFQRLRELPLPSGCFWNVNFPDTEHEVAEPDMIICNPDRYPLAIDYEQIGDQFHYRGIYQNRRFRPDTDVDRCFRGYVTVSQLSSAVTGCSS